MGYCNNCEYCKVQHDSKDGLTHVQTFKEMTIFTDFELKTARFFCQKTKQELMIYVLTDLVLKIIPKDLVECSLKEDSKEIEHTEKTVNIDPLKLTSKYFHKAVQIGKLLDQKNSQYGDAFSRCGEFLKILYPNGIKKENLSQVHAICRVFDKLCRIANGHLDDSWEDIAGIVILNMKGSE